MVIGESPIFWMGILVLTIMVIFSFLSLRYNVYCLFGSLPFIYLIKRLQFYYEGIGIYNNPISLTPEILIMAGVFGLCLRRITISRRITFSIDKLSIIILILFLECLFSAFYNRYSVKVGLFGFRGVGIPILAYFLGKNFLKRKEDFILFLKINLVTGTLVAIYGLWQQFVGLPVWDKHWFMEEVYPKLHSGVSTWFIGSKVIWTELRKFSTLNNVASASGYYRMMILFALLLLGNRKTFLGLAGLIVLLLGLIFTFARAALIGVSLMLIFFWIFKKWRGRNLLALFLVLLTIGGILWAVAPYISIVISPLLTPLSERAQKRMLSALTPMEDTSFKTRTNLLWVEAIRRFSMRPLFGYGIGSTGGVAQRFSGDEAGVVVDSMYMKLLVEQGILGIFVMGLFLVYALHLCLKLHSMLKDKFYRNLVAGVLISILVLTILGIPGSSIEIRTFSIPFWFFLGSLSAIYNLKRKGEID